LDSSDLVDFTVTLHHTPQSIGVHGVWTLPIFGLVEKGKGLEGGEREGRKGDTP